MKAASSPVQSSQRARVQWLKNYIGPANQSNPDVNRAGQVEEAAEASGQSEAARNPRVVNVLRGGILYVKIVKSLEETEDGVPARASQVGFRP